MCSRATMAGRLKSSTNRFYTGVVTNDPVGHHGRRVSVRLSRGRSNRAITNVDARKFTYDARGLVQTQTIGQGGTGESGTYAYGYDEVGRNVSLTFADGHVRTQRYDDLGRPWSVATRTRPDRGSPTAATARATTRWATWCRSPIRRGRRPSRSTGLDRVKTCATRPTAGVETTRTTRLALATNAGVALDAQRPTSRRRGHGGRRGARDPRRRARHPSTAAGASLSFETRRSRSAATATSATSAAARRRTYGSRSTRSGAARRVKHTERASGVRLRGERRRRDAPSSRPRPAPDTPSSAGSSTASTTLRLTSFDHKVNNTTSPPTLGVGPQRRLLRGRPRRKRPRVRGQRRRLRWLPIHRLWQAARVDTTSSGVLAAGS